VIQIEEGNVLNAGEKKEPAFDMDKVKAISTGPEDLKDKSVEKPWDRPSVIQ
jgi:hypothetical protein